MKDKTLIIGGGLSGLSRGLNELYKGNDVTIVEKNDEGGLAKSFVMNGFVFDIGPHVFRSRDEQTLSFVKSLIKNYSYVMSKPAIFKYNKIFDSAIPVITKRNIDNLPNHLKWIAYREIKDFKPKSKNLDNFEDSIQNQIGETLYKEFFGDYSKKWWGIDPKNLSADLAPNNLRIGEKASYGHITTDFSRLQEEIYPVNGGIETISKKLAEKFTTFGGVFHRNSEVIEFEIGGDSISKVIMMQDCDEMELRCDNVISTVPLTQLSNLLGINSTLIFRSNICVFVSLKSDEPLVDHSWIYFHDPDIIFGRVHEPIYYSRKNAPKGFTSLCVEITCFENDKIWNSKELGDVVIEQLTGIGLIKNKHDPEVLGIKKISNAYPIYTVGYKEELMIVYEKLGKIGNFETIGRSGSFSYLNMDGCIKWAMH